MADVFFDLEAVYSFLNTRMRKAGGNSAFARMMGLNDKTLSNMSNARRRLNDELLAALGLVEVERYVDVDGNILPMLEVYSKLNTAIRRAGGNSAFARLHGLNDKHLSNMMNDRRRLSKALLRVVGIRRAKLYMYAARSAAA
ncbi:hypothetical protein FKW31_10055 [Acetobacter sp. DmW_136]|uniref:hypothetical protein n=1 Tax=Acetobacter sp. DmW_136 TaxID=2591091 RepID=UPI0012398CED|nr:hypothetical protein [Acetobacter sp. DmW_136]KAA8385145.1 hypothetical protein FKW31_10055 [Acetobacter sp. DmW_136]